MTGIQKGPIILTTTHLGLRVKGKGFALGLRLKGLRFGF